MGESMGELKGRRGGGFDQNILWARIKSSSNQNKKDLGKEGNSFKMKEEREEN